MTKKKRSLLIDVNDLHLSEEELEAKYGRANKDDIETLRQDIMDDLSVIHRTDNPNGQTVLEPLPTPSKTPEKKTPVKKKQVFEKGYWAWYYEASRNEKLIVYKIISDAVDYFQLDYEYKGNGRPPAYYGDIAKAYCFKAFTNLSSWRVEKEFYLAKGMGLIDVIPCRSTINKYAQSKKLTIILEAVFKIIAEPLKEVEQFFCADASGFSNKYGNMQWVKISHNKKLAKKRREYTKLHVITGYKTKIIPSATVTEGTAHESPFFKPLFKETIKTFNVKEFYADAGYFSKDHVKMISEAGAVPYIDARKDINVPRRGRENAYSSMLQLRKDDPEEWGNHYHRRPTVESSFSAMKRKLNDTCRTKKRSSQKNELLAKVVCYNAAILGKSMLKYDLNSGFLRREKAA